MTVLFVYRGPRDPRLEDDLRRRAAAVSNGITQVGVHSGEDGLTTVRLAVEAGRERDVAEFLRREKEVLDAVQDSFGEQA